MKSSIFLNLFKNEKYTLSNQQKSPFTSWNTNTSHKAWVRTSEITFPFSHTTYN